MILTFIRIQSTVTSTFNDILATFDIKQHVVSVSTYIHGHLLYLLIARSIPDYIRTLPATDGLLQYRTIIADTQFKHNPVGSMCNYLLLN